MRPVLYVFSFLAVLGLGFWAYTEHYNTREALRDVQSLQREIADLREALALQRAEWAFLNRPSRLRELATLNFDRLGLLPLEPGQFGEIGQVSYPAVEEFFGQIDNPVTIAGEQDPEREFP